VPSASSCMYAVCRTFPVEHELAPSRSTLPCTDIPSRYPVALNPEVPAPTEAVYALPNHRVNLPPAHNLGYTRALNLSLEKEVYTVQLLCGAKPLPTADPAWQPTCNMNIASPIPAYSPGILFEVFLPLQSSTKLMLNN